MDSLINAAARALAVADPLGALNLIALRDDPPALALRGIAMAQLGDLDRARLLIKRAMRAFGPKEVLAKARCTVAEAEMALVSRDLSWPVKRLAAAYAVLQAHGDTANAAHARYLAIRRLILIGRIKEAERLLGDFDPSPLSPVLKAAHELVVAGIALRNLSTGTAADAFVRARQAARTAGIPALIAEVEAASMALTRPAARLIRDGKSKPLRLHDVEELLTSNSLIVDAGRAVVRCGNKSIALGSRPVLFALARALAEAWPADVSRETLLSRAFRARHADESHRARLRVEVGRLRQALVEIAMVNATAGGFALTPLDAPDVLVLAMPEEEEHAAVLALLADGEAWSSSALALALGTSQRTVQRALEELSSRGKVQSIGRARSRRWMAPSLTGFPPGLLLAGPFPGN